MTNHLMGAAEIADRLGVTAARIHQIVAEDPTFPAPTAVLRAGKVWKTTDVERWIVKRDKRRAAK
jgi:predicted DNA-binding transcriptional regulator AlpA